LSTKDGYEIEKGNRNGDMGTSILSDNWEKKWKRSLEN